MTIKSRVVKLPFLMGTLRKKSVRIRREIQLDFGGSAFIKPNAEFGGNLLKGNPKGRRPLSSKLPVHVTLRATRSILRLPKTHGLVNRELNRAAKRYGIRIYRWANVGNHIHLLIRIGKISNWTPFIRHLTGRIAQGSRQLGVKIGTFWAYRPHTRILAGWGRAFRVVSDYVRLNQLEGDGMIKRQEMATTKDLRDFIGLVRGDLAAGP